MLLVTGITGHSGRYFLEELIKNKYRGRIRCIVRETSDLSILHNSGLNIEVMVGDLNDKEFIYRSMNDVNYVMHIYNIHHSITIVQAAIDNNVKHVILVHTTGIYSKFKNASKEYIEIEQKVLSYSKKFKISITILRPTMIYGDLCDYNMSKFINVVNKFPVIPVINKGESLLQPVNARDLGKAYYMILMSLNNDKIFVEYNLSGDKPITMLEVLQIINRELDKNVIFVNIPLGLGVFMAKIFKFITLGKLDVIEKVQRMGENRSYSHDKATNDFEYKPMNFEDGIKIEIKEYLQKYKANK